MSRIGRMPVELPSGVQVEIKGKDVRVSGPRGELSRGFARGVDIALDERQVLVTRSSEEPSVRALHGTTRALIQNMVTGVSDGFSKVLEVEGVGYRPELDGKKLVLYIGYSHPVVVEPAEGISFEVETKARQIKIIGNDREQVGQVAADIRKLRPPEPYKGKGIRYAGEHIRRKAGKSKKGKG
ncbi:MAG: 50S ribosomal protein L6 [Anaerolineaceae bacterium]|nr:50S ribosomal protein L6 [Anaerolineaceae bacterium]